MSSISSEAPQSLLRFSAQVKQALSEQRPVVAMESTVIAHGLPFPDNIEVTAHMQDTMMRQGAVPALIGVVDGKLQVGFDKHLLERFATDPHVLKLNKADISICLAKKQLGATTVAATAHIAALAGIKVFATGGIGGVHQGVAETFDISNDLVALSQTPITVVSSGVKSILDVGKTLEMLETFGVPVIGFGVQHLPLFYCRSQKYPLVHYVDSYDEVAAISHHHWQLGGKGLLLANPIPEEAALDESQIEQWIDLALTDCLKQGIKGKAVTPFVLKALGQQDRATMQANKALLIDNARVAAGLACKIATT